MPFAPLVIKGTNLTIGSVNVSEQITSFALTGTRNIIDVPATFGNRVIGAKAGSEQWSITLNYMQGDGSDLLDTLSEIFTETFFNTGDATVDFSGSVSAEVGSDIWYGEMVVSEVTHGGDAETLGMHSVTFRLTGRPSRTLGS